FRIRRIEGRQLRQRHGRGAQLAVQGRVHPQPGHAAQGRLEERRRRRNRCRRIRRLVQPPTAARPDRARPARRVRGQPLGIPASQALPSQPGPHRGRIQLTEPPRNPGRFIPLAVTGLDFDNGTEFLNTAAIGWAGERGIYFTRSRPYKKNDQATIESKNGHLVRKYGFYYRYDTEAERRALN